MSIDIGQIALTVAVVCLFLWRISYGANSGLFAEAAGLISVLAAFASVYYIMEIVGKVLDKSFGGILSKLVYLTLAFVVYKVMTGIGESIRKLKEVPLLGSFDKVLGAVLGVIEALAMVYLIEYVTEIKLLTAFHGSWMTVFGFIRKFVEGFKG
ncbi:MAG: CvpA family protein [Butyrivibrio sp.]|nr:CvpA family protein [Butyrivibrio sp.]